MPVKLSWRMAGAGRMALHNGVVCHAGAAPFTGGCRCSAWAGKAEADRGQGSDPLFLCSLQGYQDQWWQDTESAGTRYV